MRSNHEQQTTMTNGDIESVERNTRYGNFNQEQHTTNLFDEILLNLGNNQENNQNININDEQEGAEMIRILAWNASGLSRNLDRLVTKMKRERIHFAIVTETWNHPDRHIPDICTINSISAVTPNLNRGVNGVSIVLNPEFKNDRHVKNMSCLAKDTVNGCFLIVHFAGIKIIGIYNAPSHPLDLDILLDEIALTGRLTPGEPCIFAGDFNARNRHWLDAQTNAAGILLQNWMDNWNLRRCNTGPTPTCTTVRGNSIVDHVFTNLPEVVAEIVTSPVPLTDHKPISFMLLPRNFDYAIIDRSYMRIKKELLRDREISLQFGLESRTRHEALIQVIENVENLLTNPVASNHNYNQRIVDESDKCICNFFTDIGKRVLGETRSGKRPLEYLPLQSDLLDALYSQQETAPTRERNAEIGKELCRLKRVRFEEFAEKISSKPASDVVKIIAQINANRRGRMSALQDSPEALEDYAKYFSSMSTNELSRPSTMVRPIRIEPNIGEASVLADRVFTIARIFNILEDVPWNKAAGKSGVGYDLIKAADFSVISLVARWFRGLYRIGLVPSAWTRSIIVPIPKKGDLNLIKNYRPISLTESFRKIFEHCLVRELTMIAGPMHFSQGGFRSDHCCNDMIATLHEVLGRNEGMHVAFLDIKAAYDSVDRVILWNRCRERSFSDDIIRILQRLFDHNSAQVVVNGKNSRPFGIKAGLLQGSVLSPFLYSVFIDDLASELTKHAKISLGSLKLNCTMYADDISIFAKSAQVLQMLLFTCSRHAYLNRYRFNVSKCMVIGEEGYDYKLDGNSIPKTDCFIYLGVEVGRKGILFKDFVERRCKTSVEAGMKLVSMGMNLGGFSPQIAAMLYKVFIRSKLEAGICLIPKNVTFTKKFEAAQRKILAKFFFCGQNSSGTIVRSLMNAPTMAFRQKYLRSRYVYRINELGNSHVVQTSMNHPKSFLNKLKNNVFEKDDCFGSGRERLKKAAMVEVHSLTSEATQGYLMIPADGKIPWFLRQKCEPILRKRICHWILKKCPAAAPVRCGRCGFDRCTQTHIAECTSLLETFCEQVPARFRPEFLLSNPESCLRRIGNAINWSVGRCLPHLRLN